MKMVKIGVALAVILTVGTALVLQSGCSDDPPAASSGAAEPATGLPRLVDYGAKSCIPCKMMAPILEDLAKDYAGRFEVEFVDISLRENAARAEKAGIEIMPTQILYDASGGVIDRHKGFMSKDEILAWWKKHGYDFPPPAAAESRPAAN